MKKFTASRLLILAAMAWIVLGTLVLSGYLHSDIPAIKYAGFIVLADGLVMTAVAQRCDTIRKEKQWIRAEGIVDLLFSTLLLLDPVFAFFCLPLCCGSMDSYKGAFCDDGCLGVEEKCAWMGRRSHRRMPFSRLRHPDLPQSPPRPHEHPDRTIGWTICLLYLYDAYRFRRISVTFRSMA